MSSRVSACVPGTRAQARRHPSTAELMRLLRDPEVAAVMPPRGGELATELLDRLDFKASEALRPKTPKWLTGCCDLSTLQLPLTLLCGWATAHGVNLMGLCRPRPSGGCARSILARQISAHCHSLPQQRERMCTPIKRSTRRANQHRD